MNKKYLSFLFLFIIGVTLFAPCCNVVNAADPMGEFEKEVQKVAESGETAVLNKIGGVLSSIGKYMLNAVIASVGLVLFVVTEAFMKFSQALLTWVTSEGFINIPFTHDNLFVDTGWGIMRGLTNICIVLGLVVIALSTILRIESYQMKKTLPLLLIVALLINFTPVLCGLVIDASNIIMTHFLEGGLFVVESYGSAMVTAFLNLYKQAGSPSGMLAMTIVIVGCSLFSGIIFLLFAFLFLFRYIALWMLVILSPLALFCYIFPFTKKIWNQWLSQFIQWCFIGIPAALTLYLANIMTQQMLQGELLGELSSMGKIMGYLLPVAFLVGGLLMSLQIGAMGASTIIKGAKAAGKTAGGIAWQQTRRAGRAVGAEAGRIRQSYQIQRVAFKDTPIRSLGTAIKGSWQTRIGPAIRRPATYVAAGKGILSAGRDIGDAFGREVLGIPKKKKERPTCSKCGNYVPAGAAYCPHCRTQMPTCPNCGKRAVPGARFCQVCGEPTPQ